LVERAAHGTQVAKPAGLKRRPERRRADGTLCDLTNSRKTGACMRLTGFEAIEFAEKEGFKLNKSADSVDEARSGLTIAEAEAIATDDPDLIWLEVSEAEYYGEPRNMEPER
jgi:hypothetical protein